ncbi:MAG TPA: MarR family transcriptional regulator [Pseudonocardia sp.]
MRDTVQVSRFIERFAAALTDAGMPRMPARVFVALLATDSGRLTAAELAGQLQGSAGAISGAVRYLIQTHLVDREREPGSRRDTYRVRDDVWHVATGSRDDTMRRLSDPLPEGIAVLGADTPAGARLTETLEFFAFLQREMPALVERWEQLRSRRG